jgi:hypothetical protein
MKNVRPHPVWFPEFVKLNANKTLSKSPTDLSLEEEVQRTFVLQYATDDLFGNKAGD